ncbi:hypothetical protein QUF90_14825 [Desulfococcaceae bacterium HSG9]|nr:hypothetical protein [Desulfococcaceae bacterium HSG9]
MVASFETRAQKEALEKADFHAPALSPALIKQKQFDTGPGMLASNELEKASYHLLENAAVTDNAYLYDPSRAKHLAGVLDEIAYANLLRLSFHFEQGVPLKFSEPVATMAQSQGLNRDQALADWLKQAAVLSGMKKAPDNLKPIFVEFKNGEPAWRKNSESGWNARVADFMVSTPGLAQMMNSQLNFIKKHHAEKAENQGAALKLYLARVMGLQTAARFAFIESAFDASQKQGLDYLPALAKLVADSDGMPLEIKFENPQSTLFSHISLLQALANLITADDSFGGYIPGYDSIRKRANRLMNRTWDHIQKTYADADTQALNAQGTTALDAGMTLAMLGDLYHELPDSLGIKKPLENLLGHQAEFIMAKMIRPTGEVRLVYPSSDDKTVVDNQLASQSAILLGLIRVADIAGQSDVAEKIMALYSYLENNLWNQRLGVYQSRQERSYVGGSKLTRFKYTNLDLGITVSALAEMLPLLSDRSDRHRTATRLSDFSNRLLVSQNSGNSNAESNWDVKTYDPEIVQGVDILLTDQSNSADGYIYSYQVTVKNDCPDQTTLRGPLYDLFIGERLPEGMTYIPGSSVLNGDSGFEPVQSGQNLNWEIDRLEDGDKAVITFKALFDQPERKKKYVNKVDVNGWSGGEADNGGNRCEYQDKVDLKIGADFGKIEGHVFMDQDENGLSDGTEKPISDIRFKLDDTKYAVADKGGVFVFDDLVPGFYEITADGSSINPDLLATTPLVASLEVKRRTTTRLKFGFNQYKQVFAQVYDDRNNNGKRDTDEPGVHAVRVNIRGADYHAYSAEDGHIRIDRVPVDVHKELVISEQQPYLIKVQGQNLQLGPWRPELEKREIR